MSSCGFDDHVPIDESKREETLNKLLGMKWKRNMTRMCRSNPKKNVEEMNGAATCYHGGNDQDRSISNLNKSSKYRFEVLIRETYPYVDEVPDSEVLNDYDSDDDSQPRKEKPVKHLERAHFFKNIQPTDECASRFYSAAFVVKKEDSPPAAIKQKELNYPDTFRKPWLSLLKSDSLNPQIPSASAHSNQGNEAESLVESTNNTDLLHPPAVVEELTPKRKPGAGTRLKCKSSTVPLVESEQVKNDVPTDYCKDFLCDIEMVLNHIDAERLNNAEQKPYVEKNANVIEFQEQHLPSEDLNKICDFPKIDVTNTTLVNGEFYEKQNDNICFPSSTISNTPTARVQPSVMINERHIPLNHQQMMVPNNCLKMNETQNIVPKSESPAFGTNYQIIQNNNDVSYAPAFEKKQISNNNTSILGMSDRFTPPAPYPWHDDPSAQPITSTCLTQAISAANQLLSCAPLNAQNQMFESLLPVNTSQNTTVESVNRTPMFSHNPGQRDWISPIANIKQMPSYVPEMTQQQNQISQYPVPIGNHETLKNFNPMAMHSNISMQN